MSRTKLHEREYIPINIKQKVLETSGYRCGHCGIKIASLDDDFTIDHAIPLNKGGTNQQKNLVALCETCNKKKSDNIVDPHIYYKCLPKKRKNELDQLFDEYFSNTSWLTDENLFKLDQFTITLRAPKQNHATKRILYIPVKAAIEKIRADDAFTYIQDYRRLLTAKDQSLLATTPQEVNTCYQIRIGKQNVAMLQSYIIRANWGDPKEQIKLPQIRLVLFVNKEMQNKQKKTAYALEAVLCVVIHEIQKTFMAVSKNTIFPIRIMAINSDPTAVETLHILQKGSPTSYNIEKLGFNTSPPGGSVISVSTLIWNGDKKHFDLYLSGKKGQELQRGWTKLMNPLLDQIYEKNAE